MTPILFAISALGAAAFIFILQFLIAVGRKWRHTVWLKRHGLKADARILQAEVINDEGRYLPFVRLKAEVTVDNQASFITHIDSFFSVPQLADLTAGNVIRVAYDPADNNQVRLIKPQECARHNHYQSPEMKRPQLSFAP